MKTFLCTSLAYSHVVCLSQKNVRVWLGTCLQSSAPGFLMPDQRHFHSPYSYSLNFPDSISVCFCEFLHYFLLARSAQANFAEKPHRKINSLNEQKHTIHTYSDKAFNGIVSETIQTAYLLSQDGLCRPKLTRHDMLRFFDRLLECHLTATCLI